MSGGVFRTYRGTGQAPTTVYFGKVPDRLSALVPGHPISTGSGYKVTKHIQASHVNLWEPFNLAYIGGANAPVISLGSITQAPDGTATAQKIVESTANTEHFLTTIYPTSSFSPHKVRLAVFAKAIERTRIMLRVGMNAGGGLDNFGCKTVFDLAGGQIGVPNTPLGANNLGYVAGPASIAPWGNGWYLCQMDVTIPNVSGLGSFLHYASVGLDSGSGAGAISTNYAGNGTSGLYVWRACLLPPAAWSLTDQVFFDDFNDDTMAQIDLTNSRQPGFTWYVGNDYRGYGNTPSGADEFSCSNSILTINNANTPVLQMTSAGADAAPGNTWVTKTGNTRDAVFRPPALWECKMAMSNSSPRIFAFWTSNLENIQTYGTVPLDHQFHSYGEVDFVEVFALRFPSHATLSAGVPATQDGRFTTSHGIEEWESAVAYGAGYAVAHNGVFYSSLTDPNIGAEPPGATWTAFSLPSEQPDAANMGHPKYSDQHVYSVLWLPWTHDDSGQFFGFMDGVMGMPVPSRDNLLGHCVYTPSNSIQGDNDGLTFHVSQYDTYPIFLGAGGTVDQAAYIDWVSVIK